MKTSSQQRAVGAPQVRNTSSTMPGNERASQKATSGTSENTRAVVLPHSKGMAKPPTAVGAGQEDRKFGRQLSTNNGEAGGTTITLQVVPDLKAKPNVKAPTSTRGQAVDLKPQGLAKQASDMFAPLKVDSANKPILQNQQQLQKQSKSCVTQAEAEQALAEAASDVSSNNPEETGLFKITPIESCSTNGTSDILNSAVDEEEKKGEAGIDELDQDDVEPEQTGNPQSVSEVFKQRLVNFRKQMSKQMIFADQMDLRNPQLASEFAPEIYQNMRNEENRLKVSPTYLKEVQDPKEVKDTSRAFLVEWIIDVHRKFRLVPETLYVTVFLIDRFLSLKQIRKNQLHILGVTSLLISTKYEEIYPPELKDLLSVSENKFSRAEVLKMERDMLLTMQFDVTAPSAYRFLERYRKLTSVVNDGRVFFLAQYLQEIALLDASLLQYNPSEIAAAATILSCKCIKKVHGWNREMEQATGYTDEHLAPIVEEVKSFALEVNPKFLTTLKYKFSKQEYLEVASIAFKF